jgi:4-hydroxy-4-methyl-2-oxoglutarate aldolase
VRDANLIIELGFPVFCRGLSIKGTGKNQPGRLNVPITFGDVLIHPGDIIVGDRDGVAVVPRDEVASAISSSLAREEKEAGQRKAIEQGAMTAELLNLTDTLKRFGLV